MDRFRIQGRLSPEAHGDLFLVSRVGSAAPLAMKQVRCGSLAIANAALQTAFAVKGCSHPSIVKYHEIFLHQDGEEFHVCLVMDLYDERDLSKLLRRTGPATPLPLGTVLRVAVQVCDALRCLHRSGLVHGALKPTNVLLADNAEKALLTDINLGKECGAGVTSATAYIAPEQARGSYGPKADLWALGCILLEMLVPSWQNKVTYMEACLLGDDDFQVDVDHRMKQQDCWPLRLINVVRGLLRVRPDDRLDTNATLAELSDLQDGLTVPGRPSDPRPALTATTLDSLDTQDLFGTQISTLPLLDEPLTPLSGCYPGTVPASQTSTGAFHEAPSPLSGFARPTPANAKRIGDPATVPAAPAVVHHSEGRLPSNRKVVPVPSFPPAAPPITASATSPSWRVAAPARTSTPWAATPALSSSSAALARHGSSQASGLARLGSGAALLPTPTTAPLPPPPPPLQPQPWNWSVPTPPSSQSVPQYPILSGALGQQGPPPGFPMYPVLGSPGFLDELPLGMPSYPVFSSGGPPLYPTFGPGGPPQYPVLPPAPGGPPQYPVLPPGGVPQYPVLPPGSGAMPMYPVLPGADAPPMYPVLG